MTTKVKKRLVKLPPEVAQHLASLNTERRDDYVRALRNAGWTLQAIAETIEVSRERVRQICELPNDGASLVGDLPVPTPPVHAPKQPKVLAEPSPETLQRLLELQPLVQQVRSHAKRYRAEAEEYTALIHKAHSVEGVSIYRLSKLLGVTDSALRFRLSRYGYTPSKAGKSRVYQPILQKNRAV